MAQFIVRHLEESVKVRLKRRAARHGRSMEDEVRHILRDAVKAQNHHVSKLGSRIAAHFAKVGLTTELPELHDQTPQAVQVYLRKEELDALRKVAARSRRSVAALVREAVRKVVLMPAAEGPIAIWDGEPKRSSLDHDSVHDEP